VNGWAQKTLEDARGLWKKRFRDKKRVGGGDKKGGCYDLRKVVFGA